MTPREELLDIEAQRSEAQSAERRDGNRERDRYDRHDYVWIHGHAYDLVDAPDPADVAELERGRR